MKGAQVILFALAALPGMLLVGCRQRPTPAPVSEVEVERLPDAEAVLAQLGQKAYVFKYQGGELTARFTLYHRPAGTNQEERVIFQADGDEALRLLRGGTGAPGKDGDPAGYLIVTVPGRSTATTQGELTFKFNLGEATCGKAAKVSSSRRSCLALGCPNMSLE
jgi:hypothetical protein